MSPGARRILIPLVVTVLAAAVVFVGILGKKHKPSPAGADVAAETTAPPPTAESSAPQETEAELASGDEATPPETEDVARGPMVSFDGLIALAPAAGVSGRDVPAQSIGSLDPAQAPALISLSRAGAGISDLVFSDIWETATARRMADAHQRAVERGVQPVPPLPGDAMRYRLIEAQMLTNRYRGAGFEVPALAASRVEVNGTSVNLFEYNTDPDAPDGRSYIWAETAPGLFETVIKDDQGRAILQITRRFRLAESYDLTLEQRVVNLTDDDLTVRWSQFGPSSLRLDRSRYMDRRRYHFGYLDPRDADRSNVLSGNESLFERAKILKRWKKAVEAGDEGDTATQQDLLRLWPNELSNERQLEMSWFGATNRYFSLTVHPPSSSVEAGARALKDVVDEVLIEVSTPPPATPGERPSEVIFTYLVSPERTIEPGAEIDFDMGVFAGPLDRHLLDDDQPYHALSMQKLILYQMSSFCAVCTFQWLAHILIGFLTILHNYVLFDWGLAIVGLVVLVRALLHPITKRSQISMQRFGKQMSSMKPELDKLQKKYGGDSKKMQQEQMRLMREHGANPLQMLGCLPMFLQTPVWIALYAMLYFAFDLRQEPAFFGIFQTISAGHWPFLGDLSASDHFFGEFAEPFHFLLWNVTGINLLPILMGAMFFIQQKYMAPPPSPTATPEQLQQQKIMKLLMVVMFPLMLYSAPSGLTLYILTSSTIGIFESRYVRRHITEMDLNPPKEKKRKGRAQTKPRDAQGRAYAAALKRAEEKRRAKTRGPEKKYKKKRK